MLDEQNSTGVMKRNAVFVKSRKALVGKIINRATYEYMLNINMFINKTRIVKESRSG